MELNQNMRTHRILLGILILLGLAGCALTRFLDMAFINSLDYSELAADHMTDERRLELVEGRRKLTALQFRTNVYAWWVAFATTVVAAFAFMLTMRKPK